MKYVASISLGILSFLLSGCVYTNQLCVHSRVDIGLEGTYESPLNYDFEEFVLKPQEYKIVRQDVGVYSGGGQTMYVCQLGGKLIAETYSQETSTFSSSLVEKLGNDFLFSSVVFDRTELDREKIPYSISYSHFSSLPAQVSSQDQKIKILVIDNHAVPADKMIPLMHVQSLGFRIHKKQR